MTSSLRFNVLVVKRVTGCSSFNATAGPKVSRLKITVADQRGWIKLYVSDPNLDTKLTENKSVMVKNFYVNDGIVRISQKASVTGISFHKRLTRSINVSLIFTGTFPLFLVIHFACYVKYPQISICNTLSISSLDHKPSTLINLI